MSDFSKDWLERPDEIASQYTMEDGDVDLVKLYAVPLPAKPPGDKP